VGGGIAFGPKPRDYNQKVNVKMRRLALKSAYSIKAREEKIRIIEDFSLDEPKTKDISGMLKALGINGEKTMVLLGRKDDVLVKSSRNIVTLNTELVENANTYDLMNSDFLLLMKSAVEKIKEVFQK